MLEINFIYKDFIMNNTSQIEVVSAHIHSFTINNDLVQHTATVSFKTSDGKQAMIDIVVSSATMDAVKEELRAIANSLKNTNE